MTDIPLSGGGLARGAAEWLRLAAAPTFAALALLGGLSGAEACATHAMSGMAAMYGLMAAFHLPPWLMSFSRRR